VFAGLAFFKQDWGDALTPFKLCHLVSFHDPVLLLAEVREHVHSTGYHGE
jgi:hypothetical protein